MWNRNEWDGAYAYNPSTQKDRDQKLKVILGYTVRTRPFWATSLELIYRQDKAIHLKGENNLDHQVVYKSTLSEYKVFRIIKGHSRRWAKTWNQLATLPWHIKIFLYNLKLFKMWRRALWALTIHSLACLFACFGDRIFLHCSSCPGVHYVDQAHLALTDMRQRPASAS